MRIAHLGGLHMETPGWRDTLRHAGLPGLARRLASWRHGHRAARERLVQAVLDCRPDAVVVTGGLAANALEDEFEQACDLLAPLLLRVPTLVLAGRRDVATPEPPDARPFAARFAPWMHLQGGGYPARLDVGTCSLIALDTVVPPPSGPGGRLSLLQLQRLRELLAATAAARRQAVLCLHHPVLGPRGLLAVEQHRLRNGSDLLRLLREADPPPQLVLHGSRRLPGHRRWHTAGRTVHLLHPGTAPRFSVYELGPQALQVEHWSTTGPLARSSHGWSRLATA